MVVKKKKKSQWRARIHAGTKDNLVKIAFVSEVWCFFLGMLEVEQTLSYILWEIKLLYLADIK